MQFETFDLGLVDYQPALEFQKNIFVKVKQKELFSALITCRHNPVITLGRAAKKENILTVSGVEIHEAQRGGDVTYHGPGQLTVYPIFDLHYFKQDIHWFLRKLEEAAILFFSRFSIRASRKHGLTGVWVNSEKIASIGIAVRNWITFHGVSLNISKGDLANFQYIRPCGMDIKMTSLESVSQREFDIESLSGKLIDSFREIFELSSLPYELGRQPALPCFRSIACPPLRGGLRSGVGCRSGKKSKTKPSMPAPASRCCSKQAKAGYRKTNVKR